MKRETADAGSGSNPGKTRTGKRRRLGRWIALGAAALVVVALVGGCSMLQEFKPEIDTAAMQAAALSSRWVDSPEGRVHYVAAGLPPAPGQKRVLFVHGSPGTWDAWKGWMTNDGLRAEARLLAADRIGFGGSERGQAEPSLARQVEALAAILDGEAGGKAVVVGHSLGGPIAARLAMDRPDLVAGLLLVAPSIDPAMEKRRWYNVLGATLLVQAFLPVDWITSNRELWPLKKELAAMEPRWASLAMPVVVVQGAADDLVPPENADFAERMMGAKVEVHRIPDRGHFVLWQQPETVTEPLRALLAEAGAPAAEDPATIPPATPATEPESGARHASDPAGAAIRAGAG